MGCKRGCSFYLTLLTSLLASLVMIIFMQTNSIESNKGTVRRILETGYPAEQHVVTTEDGYFLQTIRIPHGKISTYNKQNSTNKQVVLLQHGMFCSSDTWITSMNMSLAYLLADQGYDVWLGNARGNTYNKQHFKILPDDRSFWQFSFHELGVYDLAATIDYILKKTQQQSLHFISSSQGASSFLVLMSENPAYQNKISTSHHLSPVAYLHHSTSPVLRLLRYISYESWLGQILSSREVLSHSKFWIWLCQQACPLESKFHILCSGILGIAGGNWHLNETLLTQFCSTNPGGASTNQLFHFTQLYNSGKFKKFDFGPELNMKYYNQVDAPVYDLTKIKICLNLYYGDSDAAVSRKDIEKLASDLPCAKVRRVPKSDWNHYDFIWGENVDEVLYSDIVKDINEYKDVLS